jgi:hypothetical protein
MNEHDTTAEKKHDPDHRPVLTYFVNNEVEQTHAHELLASIILEQAGFAPAADYRLISEKPHHEYAPTDTVKLHEGQRFEALHRGPTPTS